jgi:hypothetical protein
METSVCTAKQQSKARQLPQIQPCCVEIALTREMLSQPLRDFGEEHVGHNSLEEIVFWHF